MNLSFAARVRTSGDLFAANPPPTFATLAPTVDAAPPPPTTFSSMAPAPLPPRMASVVDTIAGSLVRHAAPLVQADPGFQTRVASAAGSAAAAHLSPYAALATTAVVLASGVVIWRALR